MALRNAASRAPGLAALLGTGLRAAPVAAFQALSSESTAAGSAAAPSAAAALRSFTTSNLAQSAELAGLIKKELDFEVENTPTNADMFPTPPGGFELGMTDGDTLMTLKRTNGNEVIEIDIQVNNQPEPEFVEDEDEEVNVVSTVTFTASVTKGDNSIIFDLSSDRESCTIVHVAYEPTSGLPSDSYYSGPKWEEMDEELQDGITQYLAERGINEALCDYLFDLVYNKEQVEYMRWLQNMHAFLQK